MTNKTELSTTNAAWLHVLNHLVGTGRDKTTFREDVCYTVPMRDPAVTFFHAVPSYYADLLCNAQTFLRGFGNVPKQLENIIDCLEKDQFHLNATLYIPSTPYSGIRFVVIGHELHCIATLCAVDVWGDISRRSVELSVLGAYICLGLRKRGVPVELGDIQLEIGQAYLGMDNHNEAIATLWTGDLRSNDMSRFPQSPLTIDFLMEGALDGNPIYLINTIDSYKDILNG